jgi:threonylcarbamoyladenosine tRNA methylthiotransferase MtaB
MKTFSVETLGCKVNQYESEQIALLLRRRGLVQVDPSQADVRVVNSCSVTVQAASKSRQTVRRAMRLSVLPLAPAPCTQREGGRVSSPSTNRTRPRVIVTGCWATSDNRAARELPGVDAVIGHHDDVAAELEGLLDRWGQRRVDPRSGQAADRPTFAANERTIQQTTEPPLPKPFWDEGSINQAGASATTLNGNHTPDDPERVKQNPDPAARVGTRALPLLDARQSSHQRALLKVQDGCDAHCTYCIIPQLRPALWSKPIEDAVEEAQRLTDAGHVEIVLTGIFLGAYGQPTALRRRQPQETGKPLGALVEALCTRVRGLRRLRFSSLEPGDLTRDLLERMRAHAQCVPHFHLPLQSGSDVLLQRMNRQYTRDDFLRMIDDVQENFDRPAVTTDVIVGFPGETDDAFARTLEVVDLVRFVHIHAFSFSPRPNTAAARWTSDFVRGPVVNQRIEVLGERSRRWGFEFRQRFAGEEVELLVERGRHGAARHGRCERYFDVHFESDNVETGQLVRLRIERATPARTWGTVVGS